MDYTEPRRVVSTYQATYTIDGEEYVREIERERIWPSYLDRFMALVTKDSPGGCWQWNGNMNEGGYGRFRLDGRTELAHRASYVMHVGPIPDGKYLDHLCRNRGCVNPEHLEPVTPQANTDRGLGRKRDECRKGHALTGENKGARSDGRQYCKQCSRDRQAKHWHKNG